MGFLAHPFYAKTAFYSGTVNAGCETVGCGSFTDKLMPGSTKSGRCYGYQFCHVKLFNRFPNQSPFEIIEELATFIAVQLALPKEKLHTYASQKRTFIYHQEAICAYLKLEKFNQKAETSLQEYLFQQAQQIYPVDSTVDKGNGLPKSKTYIKPFRGYNSPFNSNTAGESPKIHF